MTHLHLQYSTLDGASQIIEKAIIDGMTAMAINMFGVKEFFNCAKKVQTDYPLKDKKAG